jgi:ATP diphosphatase
VNAESALRSANAKFERRFRYIEETLRDADRDPAACSLEELNALWEAAKRKESPVRPPADA